MNANHTHTYAVERDADGNWRAWCEAGDFESEWLPTEDEANAAGDEHVR